MSTDNFFNSDAFKDVIDKYEEAERLGRHCIISSEDFTDIAEYYNSNGEPEKAMKAVDTALELYPGATCPLVFKARMSLVRDNDPDKALQYAEEIEDKSDLDYFYIKAEIMIVCNNITEAETYLRECYGNVSEDEQQDFVIDVATLYADYEQWDKAKLWIESYYDKDSEDYMELTGRILIGTGQYDEGEKLFNRLLDKHPYSRTYWNSLASSQFLKGNIQESISSSEFSIAINPDDEEALLNKANGLYTLGNYSEALKYYKRFNEIRPEEESGELFQGICFLSMNQLQEALEHLKKAEQLALPDSMNLPEIYNEIIFCLSKQGNLKEALQYLDKAESAIYDKNDLLVMRGHLYLEHNDIEKAQKYFSEAIQNAGTSPHVYIRVAASMYDNGYMRVAYKILQALVESSVTGKDEGYPYLANCCYHLGMNEEFLEYLKISVRTNPQLAKDVLNELFPDEMSPEEYYNYAKKITE